MFDEDFTDGTDISNVTTPGTTTVVNLLHEEYNSAAVRLEFSVNDTATAESVQLQVRAGVLDMGEPYEFDQSLAFGDDLVRGFTPGQFAVSATMTQQGFISTGSETATAEPTGFKVYEGGFTSTTEDSTAELWNELEILYRDNQLWVWWNKLLVPPDPTESAALPTGVAVSTPYFPVTSPVDVGKIIFRLWPGTKLREIDIRDQAVQFNEFVHGQLELST